MKGFGLGAIQALALNAFAVASGASAQAVVPGAARIGMLLGLTGVLLLAWRRLSHAQTLSANGGVGAELATGVRAMGIGMLVGQAAFTAAIVWCLFQAVGRRNPT